MKMSPVSVEAETYVDDKAMAGLNLITVEAIFRMWPDHQFQPQDVACQPAILRQAGQHRTGTLLKYQPA